MMNFKNTTFITQVFGPATNRLFSTLLVLGQHFTTSYNMLILLLIFRLTGRRAETIKQNSCTKVLKTAKGRWCEDLFFIWLFCISFFQPALPYDLSRACIFIFFCSCFFLKSPSTHRSSVLQKKRRETLARETHAEEPASQQHQPNNEFFFHF